MSLCNGIQKCVLPTLFWWTMRVVKTHWWIVRVFDVSWLNFALGESKKNKLWQRPILCRIRGKIWQPAGFIYSSFAARPMLPEWVGFIDKHVDVCEADYVLHSRVLKQRFMYALMIRFIWIIECAIASQCTLEYPFKTKRCDQRIRTHAERIIIVRCFLHSALSISCCQTSNYSRIMCLFSRRIGGG